MPSAQEILASLRLAANETIAVSILWHVLAATAGLALVLGWRPSRRRAGVLLSTPIASAAVVAFAYGNPFNGTVLGVLAIVLAGMAWRFTQDRIGSRPSATSMVGVGMILFGLIYPHFLETRPLAIYLVAAPTGLIPCPSLSLVIGFTLLAQGLGSRSWSLTLALVGLFYGFFGVLRLDVRLDIGLVLGAVTLLVTAARSPARLAQATAGGGAHFIEA